MARLSTIDKEVVLDRIVKAHQMLTNASHKHVVSLTVRYDEQVYITIAKPDTGGIERKSVPFAIIATAVKNPIVLEGHMMIERLNEAAPNKKL